MPAGTLRSLAATATSALCLALAAAPAAEAQATQKVTIAVAGTSFLDISYFSLLLPTILGYWAEEGFSADVFPVPSSSDAIQQLALRNIDFAQVAGAAIIQSNAMQNVPVRTLITNFALGWGLAVKGDGPIQTGADLKGTNIGIVSVSTGGVSLVKSFARRSGLDPERDVTMVATGVGAQPLLALQNNQVQALMYWSSALVGFQAMDPTLRIIKDPTWAEMPDYSFATSLHNIETRPEVVEGISRGIAKAMVFAEANPACVQQLYWKAFPDSVPTNIDRETAARNDIAKVEVLLADQRNASKLNPGGVVAGASAVGLGSYQDFLYENGIITNKVDPAQFVTPGGEAFFARINDFDAEAIRASAIACNF
jgi:NitT/TauT family transport system substrate-binding protein